MASISNAVGPERRSKVVGYEVLPGNFQETTPNLPMSIAIFGQANTANQTGLDTTGRQVTSADEAGEVFGFGSQIHQVMRILRARQGDVIGGIPTIVYAQTAPAGGAAQVNTITVGGGPANASSVHIVTINGRSNFDGASLEVSISEGDAVADVAGKIRDVINAARSCPVSASATLGVVTTTCKWVGENSSEINITVTPRDGNLVALTYAVTSTTPGAGDSSAQITASLQLFNERWNTIVINSYGKTRNGLFETFNGVPGVNPASGRYNPTIFKPFVALFGDKTFDTVANVIANLDNDQATAVQCPAPNSNGFSFEAAANVCVLLARQAQNSPHLDAAVQNNGFYPDMPIPTNDDVGVYADYNNRDLIVKGGGSTVVLDGTRYRLKDLVTTYFPTGETNPSFSYVRNLIQDWNVAFGYRLREEQNVVDHVILNDNDVSNAIRTVKPGQWRAELRAYFIELSLRGLLVDVDFSVASLQVGISGTNPDRFETFFRYKRSGIARITSTTTEAGFNFG